MSLSRLEETASWKTVFHRVNRTAGDVLGATCNTSVCESLWIYLRRHLRALVCLDVKGQGRLDLAAER